MREVGGTMDKKCKAKAKSTGNRCTRPPVSGALVCFQHGGGAPQVRAAGIQRLLQADAERTVKGFAITPVTDPLTALSELAGEVVAIKSYLHSQVQKLGEMLPGDEEQPYDAIRQLDVKGTEQVHALFSAYERGLDRAVTTLATIAKLNIDERLARITEAQQMTVIRAIEAAFAAAGVTGPAAEAGKKVAARHLRSVA